MKKKRILVVDDELDMRVFLSTLLETSGYRPIVAEDGADGLDKAKKVKPELIILDVMMPKMAGTEIYQQLKTDDELKDIPVIVLSAISEKTFFHSQNMLSTYLGRNIPPPEAYIEKPPEAEDILQRTNELLSTPSAAAIPPEK